MSTALAKPSGHIPEAVKDRNYLLRSFAGVFDAMQEYKNDQTDYFRRSFMPAFAQELRLMRWWVDNFGGEYDGNTTLEALDCFYTNLYYIYSRKGTQAGIQRLIDCLLRAQPGNPVAEVTHYYTGWPVILFDAWRPNDQLPSGQSIADEINEEGPLVPTLIGSRWGDYKNEIVIEITSGTLTPEYQGFLANLLKLYCPAIGSYNQIITFE
jgi:hypothetical protein